MTTSDPTPPLDHEARLANRATLLTLAGLCSFLVALVAMPLTFEHSDALLPRIVASAPLAMGTGAFLGARSARVQLAAVREEEREQG